MDRRALFGGPYLGALALAVYVASAQPVEAHSFHGNNTCPKGSFADGCYLAPITGQFQVPTLFTTGPQTGQVYTSFPSWNVAAIHYPVGYDKAVLTPGAAANDPWTHAPSDCVSTTSGTYAPPAAANTSNGYLLCTSTSGSIDFEGIDFGEHNCTPVVLVGYTGTVTVNNSRLASGAGCSGGTGQLYMPNTSGKNPRLILTHSELDGREAWNVKGRLDGCSGVAPNIVCNLTISSMSGTFNIGDMFDDVGFGLSGSEPNATPAVYHAQVVAATPGNCASGTYFCGAGVYQVSYFYQTWGSTTLGSASVANLPASGATCSQTSGGTACQNIIGIENGMLVNGPCIAPGTYVLTIPDVAHITLSQNATCTASGSSNTVTVSMPSQSVSFTGGLVGSLLPVVVDYSGTGNSVISYNNIHDTPIRPINLWANGTLQFDHNYCSNMVYAASWNNQHGECFDVTGYTGSTSPITLGGWAVKYNTFYVGAAPTGLYAAWAYGGNPFGATGYFIFPSLVVDNNVLLGNCPKIGGTSYCQYANGQFTGTNGNGLLTVSRNVFQYLELIGNWIDASGQTSCVVSSADVKTFRGTISGTDFEITSNNIAIPLQDTIGDQTIASTGISPSGIQFTTVTGAASSSTLASGGTTATAFASSGTGTGFAVNDTLTLANGAVVKVTSVSGGQVAGTSQTGAATSAPGTNVQAVSTSGSGVLNSGSYVGPLFNTSGYAVNDTITLSNGGVEVVDAVSAGVITAYHQTTAPTLASGANMQVPTNGTSGAGMTGATGPLFNFTGNTVHISQTANTTGGTWAAYTPMGDATGSIVVSNNYDLNNGQLWGVAAPYLQGSCNLINQGPP